jgi:hypothetical protein
MPCNTIVRSKVEFLATSTDLTLLAGALKALGWAVVQGETSLQFSKGGSRPGRGSYDKATGRLTLPSNVDGDEIKRAYSEQTVEAVAKKNGWQITWKTNAAGNREANVLRRGM